jgi:hypothetical protein
VDCILEIVAKAARASTNARNFVSRQLRAVGGLMMICAGASVSSLAIGVAGIALLIPVVARATRTRELESE